MLAFCCFNPVLLLYSNSFSQTQTVFCCEETLSPTNPRSQMPKENAAGLKNLTQTITHFLNVSLIALTTWETSLEVREWSSDSSRVPNTENLAPEGS